MKKLLFSLALILLGTATALGQTAVEVLDKCAATVSAKDGLQASFRMESAQYGNTSGTIALKGRKFHATTPVASMWFDGTTQWTYLKRNNEVSVVTPNESQLQALNPYHFINMYKQGYKATMTTSATDYRVHLNATDGKHKIKELFITVSKKSYQPKEIQLLQGNKWTTFYVTDLKIQKQDDGAFRFNSKDFPSAEVIDLR